MNPVLLALGIAVLVLAVVDLLWTTLWVDGGSGPVSTRLTTWTWRGLRRVGHDHPRVLGLAGPLVLVLTLVTWVGLIWAGWTLLFAGGENALVDTSDPGSGVSWAGRVYFVAYAMFTMGNGDFAPVGGWWQVATALTTASGMLFVTLGVSYVLSVLGAVVDKRSFATSVVGIDRRSEGVVETGWDGEDFHDLDEPIDTLAANLSALAQQHEAYPILHYYHSERAGQSSALAVAVLDDALTLLRFGVDSEAYSEPIVETARSSVEGYLETLDSAFIEAADEPPPPPDLDQLADAGVPTVSREAFDRSVDHLYERRRELLAVVQADARHWPPAEDR